MAERPTSAADSFSAAVHTPLPAGDQDSYLEPPRASRLYSDSSSTQRESFAPSTKSAALLAPATKTEVDNGSGELEEQPRAETTPVESRLSRRWLILLGAAALLAILILVVVLPVYFTVVKPKNNATAAASADPSATANGPPSPSTTAPVDPGTPQSAITGGDGSTVTTEDGTTFTYNNKFGGYWVSDPNDPFNNGARPNSWTPALNETWRWGRDRVYGVNLGGLFVLEPFISPALFQKYPGASDEWELSEAMAADTSPGGGLQQIEEHYKTFITEQDIAEIAGAGLNWIRLSIPFWAIEKWPGEPFLERTSWTYILRVIQWCRKYGLRVKLDLHTIPGSQNSYNHSGKGGQVNFLNGVMGYANAQRALYYIRVFTQFFSQPQYKDVVQMFGIMNEPRMSTIGKDTLSSFYLEVYTMIRNITGVGEGNGPYISFHNGFSGFGEWDGFLPGADRIVIDAHPYFAFDGSAATEPIATGLGESAGGIWPERACTRWAGAINSTRTGFGVTIAGEFSNGYNDCGLFLNGITNSHNYGGDCDFWEDTSQWDDETKAGVLRFAMASMDALQDFFFWTWKIGESTAGRVQTPLWSYQHGLQNGFMPPDPRTSRGVCASYGVSGPVFDGNFEPWQLGGAGAGDIAAGVRAQFPWPPASVAGVGPATLLPSYAPTGPVATLPPLTLALQPTPSVDLGSGWFNPADTAGAPTPIAGCTYPDAWDAEGAAVPPLCSADTAGVARRAVTPGPTPAP